MSAFPISCVGCALLSIIIGYEMLGVSRFFEIRHLYFKGKVIVECRKPGGYAKYMKNVIYLIFSNDGFCRAGDFRSNNTVVQPACN
jgi:hypothetical protein